MAILLNLVKSLVKSIVTPHFEYCIQPWQPYNRDDIDVLENIQRRATKFISLSITL